MIDDAPAKHGYYTPGSHLQIRSSEILAHRAAGLSLIFAWAFFNEIADQVQRYLANGGRLVVPLPDG